jgi:hypothetical protein
MPKVLARFAWCLPRQAQINAIIASLRATTGFLPDRLDALQTDPQEQEWRSR